MNIQEKINDELQTIEDNKKDLIEKFEEAKSKFIKLLQDATPETICNLEQFQEVSHTKYYASLIEILNTKLRVYKYLTDQTDL